VEQSRSERGEENGGRLAGLGVSMCELEYQVDDNRRRDLQADSIVGAPVKAADAQILLDPAKEQLDLPTRFVQLSDCRGRACEIVGKQGDVASTLDCQLARPPGLGKRIGASTGQTLRQAHDAITDDTVAGPADLTHQCQRCVLLDPGDEAAAMRIQIGPEAKIQFGLEF